MKRPAVAVACVLLGCGCASEPKLLRHYATLESTPSPSPLVLSVFSVGVSTGDDPPLVARLTDRAQAELVGALAAKLPAKDGASKLIDVLNAPTRTPPEPCAWADRTTMKKRLVFTLLGELVRPADRIDKLDIRLTLRPQQGAPGKPPQVDAAFRSWDRFDSVYGTFNLGSATYTQTDKLSLGAGRTGTSNVANDAGSVVKVFDFGYDSDKTLNESVAYGMRRLSVGGALTETVAQLVQEGGPNINLFGSSTATLTFRLLPTGRPAPVYRFTVTREDKPLAPARAAVERCMSRYPRTSAELVAAVSGTVLVREVVAGDGTVSEGDDTVRLQRRALSGQDVILATSDELSVQRFGLASCPSNDLRQCARLHIEQSAAGPATGEEVHMATVEEAAALRAWLVERSKRAPVRTIASQRIGVALPPAGADVDAKALKGITADTARRLSVVRLSGNEG